MASRANLLWRLSWEQELGCRVGGDFDVVIEPAAAATPTAGNGA
jgi:hypothetical protein